MLCLLHRLHIGETRGRRLPILRAGGESPLIFGEFLVFFFNDFLKVRMTFRKTKLPKSEEKQKFVVGGICRGDADTPNVPIPFPQCQTRGAATGVRRRFQKRIRHCFHRLTFTERSCRWCCCRRRIQDAFPCKWCSFVASTGSTVCIQVSVLILAF